jgi:magnesium-transporting ATPase (P-type)
MPSCVWPTPACCKVMGKQAAQSDYKAICHRSFWPVTLRRAGESDPVAMGTTAADDKPHESKHIAFMSSQVLNGAGYGIVIRCGDNTFIGKINALAATTKIRETTLQVDVGRFVKFIAIVAVSMAIVLFSVGLGRGMSFVKAFVNGIIVVLVANIPQGLPATVTSALTLTAERMKSAHVLVKRTDIIESLGSATRIASDKTGTLTQNKMTVMNCWVNCQFRSAREIEATLHRALSPTKRSLSRRLSRASQSSLARSSINAVKKVLSRVSGSAAYRANDADMSEKASSVGGQGLPAVAELDKQQVPRPHLQRTSQYGDVLSRMSLGMNSVSAMVCSLRLWCNIL